MKTKLFLILLLVGFQQISFGQEWHTDLATAQQQAKIQNRNIVLVFAGSDWCAPCIKLEKRILNTKTFKEQAKTKWVLLKADFPRMKKNRLSKEQALKNSALASAYNREGYFPMVVLLNAEGNVIWKTDYHNQTPEEFVNEMNQHSQKT